MWIEERGLRSALFFIAIYLKVVRAKPVVRGFPLREEGQVELWETPKHLGAGRSCNSSDDDVNTVFSRKRKNRQTTGASLPRTACALAFANF
ncbi:MAG: hypothetical protein DMF26_12605 [Verrucomicrobia bacterium]|nr:MAG: hypothetical protein DMF26_12605 [Verrucomicrobiota bacterium]